MVCTPAVVCTIIGNTEEMKMRKIGETLPTPNQRMAIGIQAMGDMGRSSWKIGFKVEYAPPTHPIHRPSGTANATASRKPVPTRNKDAPMCSNNVPSRTSSYKPVATAQGVGKMALWVAATANHQAAISAAITASDGTACRILLSNFLFTATV